jgi:hypothetical protein
MQALIFCSSLAFILFAGAMFSLQVRQQEPKKPYITV